MKKTKASMMKALRDARIAAGLVEFRRWVTPETKRELEMVADMAERREVKK